MKNNQFKGLSACCVAGVLLLFLTSFSAAAQQMPQPCFMQNTTFQAGEELVYRIYYNWNFVWLSAGEVRFKIDETPQNEYHVAVKGSTYSSYEWFFKARDNYDTWICKANMLPTVAVRDVQEGKIKFYDKIVFDQNTQTATTYHGSSKDDTHTNVSKVNDCMHDLLSIIYYCRNIDYSEFKNGAEFPVKLFMDNAMYPLKVQYRGKKENKYVHRQGHYNTIHFSPQVLAGNVFKEGSQPNVYVSDDANRIPVLVESPVSVGSVKAVLVSYKGLRYDFGAKVD